MDIQAFEKTMGARLETFFLRTRSLQLYFDTGYMLITNVMTMWRIVYQDKIISSVMDHFVCRHDVDGLDYWTMELEEPETHDYDEYREELFKQLASHSDCAIQKCKQLLEGETVASVEIGSFEDVKITFSNGAVLECFTICSDRDVPSIMWDSHSALEDVED